MAKSRQGTTLIELLFAMMIGTIGVVGMFSLWSTSMAQLQDAQEWNIATQIARQDIEKVKAMTWRNFARPNAEPFTLTQTVQDGQTIYQASWDVSVLFYYDASGNVISHQLPVSQRRFSSQRHIRVLDVILNADQSNFTYNYDSRVRVETVVKRLPQGDKTAIIGTVLVRGGI